MKLNKQLILLLITNVLYWLFSAIARGESTYYAVIYGSAISIVCALIGLSVALILNINRG